MRKVALVLAASMLFVLASCGVSPPGDLDEIDTSGPVETIEPDVSTAPVVEYEPVILTEEHIASMQNYLRGCTYLIFMQTMENGYEGQAVYSTTRYSFSMNVEQGTQTVSMRYITVDGINREGVGYKLFSDGEKIMASEDGLWAEAGDDYASLVLDLSQFSNALDVFEYLLHDIQLPVGVEGLSTGELWTFELTEPAVDSLLTGIKYDSLGDATYKFTFRSVDDTIRPDSVSVRVNYTIADTEYYVESEIQMNSFGNTKIATPEVGTKA